MRKVLLLLIMIMLFAICVLLPQKSVNDIITTWNDLTIESTKLTERAEKFDKKNKEEFADKIDEVVDEYVKMEEQRELYDDEVEKIKNNQVAYNLKTYNIQYLWMEIGKYASDQGITLTMNVNQSETAESLNSTYKMCDIEFQGIGLYAELNTMLENIEENDALGFYIDSFKLEPLTEEEIKILRKQSEYWDSFIRQVDTNVLKLTFSALEIPVNTADLTLLTDELMEQYSTEETDE